MKKIVKRNKRQENRLKTSTNGLVKFGSVWERLTPREQAEIAKVYTLWL